MSYVKRCYRITDMKRVVFSGIQPSGNLHIGNYIGAVKQWVNMQTEDRMNVYCIVDMHAITVPQDPAMLREKTLELAAIVMAAGIDLKKSLLFVQSHNSDHANLAWALNCFASMGQMNRMTQFKEKSDGKEFVSVGLFDYPVLMAADILLYGTTEVPVGDDQKQHVELARDLAERFNKKFGETFVVPTPVIPEIGARIMSLQDPEKKMSKSDPNPNATIGLLDDEALIRKKIASAVTDSQTTIAYDKARPGVYNLIEIYSQISGETPKQVEEKFVGKGYREFKSALADVVVAALGDLQKRYHELRSSGELELILKVSGERARSLSHPKLLEVFKKVGFVA